MTALDLITGIGLAACHLGGPPPPLAFGISRGWPVRLGKAIRMLQDRKAMGKVVVTM